MIQESKMTRFSRHNNGHDAGMQTRAAEKRAAFGEGGAQHETAARLLPMAQLPPGQGAPERAGAQEKGVCRSKEGVYRDSEASKEGDIEGESECFEFDLVLS